jgi:transposase InsO family protein
MFFFPEKPLNLPDKYTLWREFAEDLSPEARLRLEWMIFYETVSQRNATKTAKHFGISRKTFHKWSKRFQESGEKPKSLEDHSRAPKRKRQWEVSFEQEERIVHLRKRYMKYGKKKLKVIYQQDYGEEISTWKIERVIRKHQLFPDKVEYQKRLKRKARRAKKARKSIFAVEQKFSFGHLWHIDAIILWWYGARRVIFTAVEDITRIGYARVYGTNSSRYAEDFLNRLMYLVEGKVEIMHSDNGSEFAGDFARACELLNIEQAFSRPRTPKDNPLVERYNWTVQDEWLSLSDIGLDQIGQANQDLSEWLIEYNHHRPHENLDYRTPLVYAQEEVFKEVLPMWSARTIY